MTLKTQFEVECPTMDTRISERTITETYDYHLTRYKVIKEILPSQVTLMLALGAMV